jgi:ABC-type polysaccharide/polyol phosphate export permease
MVATMNVFYRDVQYLTGVALSLLFYLVPVFYRPQQAGAKFSRLLMLNPVAVLMQSYRDVFFYQRAPEWGPLLIAFAASFAIGGVGYLFYCRFQSYVIDAL